MKILIDLTSLADNFSGIERYALNISKELIKHDNLSKYILVFKNHIHKEFDEFRNNKNVEFKVVKGKNKLIFNQIILPYHLYSIKADKYLFLAFPSPILFRKKEIINTIHDLTAWDYPDTMKNSSRLYFKASILNAVKISKNIITVSQFSKDRITEMFNKNQVDIVYNGISNVFLNYNYNEENLSIISEKYKLPKDYIMCLCTIEPRKNIELLIEAYSELRSENKIQSKLVLVGRNGWKVDNLLKKVNEKYSDDVIVTGFIEDIELPQIYIKSKAFIFPSLYEGFGIPVIEAMYMGVPIICSNTSSLPEIIGGCGTLFKNNDKNDLKEKIIYVLNQDEQHKEEMIQKAKRRASNFSWINESNKLMKIILK